MYACDRQRRANQSGFSLVELLVSLVFMSILMTGMLRVFASSLSNFVNTTESINTQRSSRWGLLKMQDDLFQLGYLMPPRVVTDLIGNAQPPIMIETPDAAFTYTDTDGTVLTVTPTPDVLEMVMDIPLEARGTLAAAPAINDSKIIVTVPYGGADVRIGDLAFIADSAWEVYKINDLSLAGSTLTLKLEGSAGLLDAQGNDKASVTSGMVSKTHFATAPVEFIRPLQVVRYSILPMALDPANDAAQVPCLVRQIKNLTDPAFTPTVPAPEIIVEGVTGFALDWSLNGGQNWIRQDAGYNAAPWVKVKDATDAALATLGATNPFIQLLTDYAAGTASNVDPFWFNYVPVLIKIDVETRSRIRRTEFTNDAVQAAAGANYRTRRHTLMVSPRNFSLGNPSGI